MKNKPSDFINHPFASVLNKTEHEMVARNIMVILKRTGNEFRPLSWEQYKTERLKDGSFTTMEKVSFDKVIDYCISAQTAKLFSKSWKS